MRKDVVDEMSFLLSRDVLLLTLFRLLYAGWTLQQFGFVVCIITTTHFAAEAYPSNPGPAIVLVVGAKNIVSFGKPVSPALTRIIHVSLALAPALVSLLYHQSIDQSTTEKRKTSFQTIPPPQTS